MNRPVFQDEDVLRRNVTGISQIARPLGAPADLRPLLQRIADRRYVLLGEASHGTGEYYRWRAEITRQLITAGTARFVAVEGDWPDCYAVNRWVKGLDDGPDRAVDVLQAFQRWPTWMWANAEVAEFLDWLRDHNSRRPPEERVGFYGLDVYSLWESMEAVLAYVAEHEPDSVDAVRQAWRCFQPYAEDPQEYAWATRMVSTSCERSVVEMLRSMRPAPAEGDDDESRFNARQNAEVAVNAERYYRAMVSSGSSSWNIRDIHMVDTLDRLMAHHGHRGQAVVWEHNTHIGDARATPMAYAGMVNVGQLVRERHGQDDVVAVGFGCHAGNWVPTAMGRRYDAFCFLEQGWALHPLHAEPVQHGGERDTFPFSE
jgi:erythromycin esterase-like protein